MNKIAKPENSDNRDPMFAEAARLTLTENRGSTSSIQRRLGLGYVRAGRIMDELEAAGIVAPMEVIGKPRKVLVDERELEKILTSPTIAYIVIRRYVDNSCGQCKAEFIESVFDNREKAEKHLYDLEHSEKDSCFHWNICEYKIN